jgi:CheY-like chemotaxis protein
MKKVLVIDDDNRELDTLEELLKRDDLMVLRAHGGPEAISQLNHGPFDAVICDLIMPEINGIELMRKVNGEYPFLLLTEDGQLPFLAPDDLDLVQGLLEKSRLKKDLFKALSTCISRWKKPARLAV